MGSLVSCGSQKDEKKTSAELRTTNAEKDYKEEEKNIEIAPKEHKILRYWRTYESNFDIDCVEYENAVCREHGDVPEELIDAFVNYEKYKNQCMIVDGLITENASENIIGGKVRVKDMPVIEVLNPRVSLHDEEMYKTYVEEADADAYFYYDYKKMGQVMGDLLYEHFSGTNKKKILVIGDCDIEEEKVVPREEYIGLKEVIERSDEFEIIGNIYYGEWDSLSDGKIRKYKEADIIILGVYVENQKELLQTLKQLGYPLGSKQEVYAFKDVVYGVEETFESVAEGEIKACFCTDVSTHLDNVYDTMQKLLNGEVVNKMNSATFQIVTREEAKNYKNLSCYKMNRMLKRDTKGNYIDD